MSYLSIRLKRIVEMLVGVALSVAILAVLPGAAEAQSTARVVVEPGDSLWSISQERLAPNATPWRVDSYVERLYTLNQDRIGGDPNLIFPGQKLLLPPVAQKPSVGYRADPGARPASSESASEAVANEPQQKPAREAIRKAVGEPTHHPIREPLPKLDRAPAPGPLPQLAPSAPPLVRLYSEILDEDRSVLRRKVLGIGIIGFTLVIAALMAWKLPMRRTTRWDTERWGMQTGYSSAARPIPPLAYAAVPERREDGRREPLRSLGSGGRTGDTPETKNNPAGRSAPARYGVRDAVRDRRLRSGRRRSSKRRPLPRTGLALGAHSPDVRYALRRARAALRAPKTRPPKRGKTAGLSRPQSRAKKGW